MGRCKEKGVIYQALVTNKTQTTEEKYIGMTGTTFYQRHKGHTSAFRHKEDDTELSKHIFELRRQKCQYKIQFKIIDRAQSITPPSKICNLCTLEKYYLIHRKDLFTLNTKNEFGRQCYHRRFTKLSSITWKFKYFYLAVGSQTPVYLEFKMIITNKYNTNTIINMKI